jgi:3-mercaptopyruvate sulfurtransferase SseA
MLARALSGFGLLALLAAPAGARPRLLVSTAWLAEHLSRRLRRRAHSGSAECVLGVKLLGYRVALYDGSLTAWRKVPGAPLVTGPQAR